MKKQKMITLRVDQDLFDKAKAFFETPRWQRACYDRSDDPKNAGSLSEFVRESLRRIL